jgi:hypothetical protein
MVEIDSRAATIGSHLVATRLGLVAIGSHRVAISLTSCYWFSREVAIAGSVHLLCIMHLGAF